jgi:hypothetical protein
MIQLLKNKTISLLSMNDISQIKIHNIYNIFNVGIFLIMKEIISDFDIDGIGISLFFIKNAIYACYSKEISWNWEKCILFLLFMYMMGVFLFFSF